MSPKNIESSKERAIAFFPKLLMVYIKLYYQSVVLFIATNANIDLNAY